MGNILYNDENLQYIYDTKDIIKKQKSTQKQEILFSTQKTLRLIKNINRKKALFYVLAEKKLIMLDYNSSKVHQIELLGRIVRINFSTKMKYIGIFTDEPKRFVFVHVGAELEIIRKIPPGKLGLICELDAIWVPRLEFEIIDETELIIFANMFKLIVFDLKIIIRN